MTMKAILLLLMIFVAGKGSPSHAIPEDDCVCGQESLHPRIIRGHRSVVGHQPWIVYIQKAGGWDSCTGSLISDRFVLTAGHCVPAHGDPFGMTVHFGQECGIMNKWHKNYNPVKVTRIIRHPEDMDVSGTGNDIALLEIEKPKFGTVRRVMPVCLTANASSSFDNFLVAGWGLVDHGLELAANDCLNEAEVDVLNDAECQRHGPMFKKSENIICVGGERNICRGDSGAPLMSRVNGMVVQTGIASFGRADCSIVTKSPSGFERIQPHVQWIREKTAVPGSGACFK